MGYTRYSGGSIMDSDGYQLLVFLTIIIKIILAYLCGKLFAHIISAGKQLQYENSLIMAALLPALLMMLILEIHRINHFGYFLIGLMALLLGIGIGRRSLKWSELPLGPVLLMVLLGILFGLGYYGFAFVGIIIGLLAFWKYGNKIQNMKNTV
jgi:hypothetical protein